MALGVFETVRAARLAALAVLAFAPATLHAQEEPAKTANDPGYVLEQFPDKLPETTLKCIQFRTLYDWRALNAHNLIVWAPTRKHPYHLQLERPCRGLRFAHQIGFTSNDSQLCGFGGDSILVQEGGGAPDRCPIGAITPLTDEGLKRLIEQAPGRSLKDKREAVGKE
ncbi:MAG: hypothetical protein FJX59_13910 [Alphaproteobacteria bacterium]|nr:hypothetical protein [Alphaproteobacteria bacterium]